MKRLLAFLMIALLLLAAGCGDREPVGELPTLFPETTATQTPGTEIGTQTPGEAEDPVVTDATEPPSATPSATPAQTPSATPAQTGEGQALFVIGDGVNVRSGAGTNNSVLVTLAQNSPVTAYREESGWRYIEYSSGKYGYILAKYLGNEPVPQATMAPYVAPNNPKYNSNVDINDNVFLDALEYTGYNLAKHRADGNMWVFILGKYKEGMGYLSGLGYDYGRTSGYEVNAQGYPDIARMKANGGMVCASYVTYVYFNYLPHVAGIDTSNLTRPENSCSAQSWRLAAEDWVKKGLSRKISFTAKRNSDGTVVFKPAETIPTGSIMVFKKYGASDWADARHVCIYAAHAGGYHWMTHVGNERGPEMVTVEHMGFSGTPEVPLEIITPPISFS